MHDVTEASFTTIIFNSKKPVLAYFWAEWCGPCKMLAPVLEQLDAEYSETLTIVKINTDEEITLAKDHDILSIPTMILFVGGKEVSVMTGAKNKPMLLKELKKHITL